jgi:DNA-binding NtrC family response regulator
MSDSEALHLLLVDDELDFLEATSRALSRRGFAVKTAEDGVRALELIKEHNFDVIVLDVRMPGMDGAEVFHQVKQLKPTLPVLMLTGHGSIKQAFETSREGVFEYLTKPCDIDKLVKVARRACAARASAPTAQSIRVLLVDDDADFVTALSTALGRRGFQVEGRMCGSEAIALLAHSVFDVAVVDLVMPEIDGLEVLKRIKQVRPALEVLMLTGHPSVRQAIAGMADVPTGGPSA